VHVYARVLRGYSKDWGRPGCVETPCEKSVDVSLALDIVTCGLDGLYDVGVVMSSDQDIVPALEYMDRRRIFRGKPLTEVAAWRGDLGRRPNRITVGKGRPFCHWLSQQDYWGVQDERDYTIAAQVRPGGVPPKPGHRRRPARPGHCADGASERLDSRAALDQTRGCSGENLQPEHRSVTSPIRSLPALTLR